jgi:hypothetical protein
MVIIAELMQQLIYRKKKREREREVSDSFFAGLGEPVFCLERKV